MSILFPFVGGSGVGKSVIQHSISDVLKFLTNHTTREIRQGEIDGIHIKQVTKEHFLKLLEENYFFEHTHYANNYYGSPNYFIHEMIHNKVPLQATLDINGALQMKEKLGEDRVKIIYIKPPSINVLEERMRKRGDSEEKIKNRLEHLQSANELDNEKYADYIIVNDDLNEAIQQTMKIVIKELTNLIKGEKLNDTEGQTT